MSPVGSVLTDPGPLCAGRTVVLNCTGGQAHQWMYDMSQVVSINDFDPPPAEPVELSGVQFTFSQLSPFPNLITQISFMSSQEMNGRILTCTSLSVGSIVTSEVTLTIVEGDSKFVEDHANRPTYAIMVCRGFFILASYKFLYPSCVIE